MMTKSRFGLKGIGFGLAFMLSVVAPPQAGATPLGFAAHFQDAAALPPVDVQARRPTRPVRRNVRRNRDAAIVAGALLGAAVIGGAIIANSEAQRREERRRRAYYNYGEPQPYYGAPRRVYRSQPQYYEEAPTYYSPQPRTYYQRPRGPANNVIAVPAPDRRARYNREYAPDSNPNYYTPRVRPRLPQNTPDF